MHSSNQNERVEIVKLISQKQVQRLGNIRSTVPQALQQYRRCWGRIFGAPYSLYYQDELVVPAQQTRIF